MFGGLELYCDGLFFGLIDGDTPYLKVDDETRPDFERVGSGPFLPYAAARVRQYYELPAGVLEDHTAVRPWIERALAAARRKVTKQRKRPRR